MSHETSRDPLSSVSPRFLLSRSRSADFHMGVPLRTTVLAILATPVSQACFVRGRFQPAPAFARASLRSLDTTDARLRPQPGQATGRVLRSTPKGKQTIDRGLKTRAVWLRAFPVHR